MYVITHVVDNCHLQVIVGVLRLLDIQYNFVILSALFQPIQIEIATSSRVRDISVSRTGFVLASITGSLNQFEAGIIIANFVEIPIIVSTVEIRATRSTYHAQFAIKAVNVSDGFSRFTCCRLPLPRYSRYFCPIWAP